MGKDLNVKISGQEMFVLFQPMAINYGATVASLANIYRLQFPINLYPTFQLAD